jgi:SAM-dependent methyltransferase
MKFERAQEIILNYSILTVLSGFAGIYQVQFAGKTAFMRCRICTTDHENIISRITNYQDRDSQYYYCSLCSSYFLHPLPEKEMNLAFSGKEKAEERNLTEARREKYYEHRIRLIERHLNPFAQPPALLEIGCGAGWFLSIARKRGWRVQGVEISPELAEQSRKNNPGVIIYETDFLRMQNTGPDEYDAIVGLDVIEHIPEPGKMLSLCYQFLKKGGLLLLQTPNARSLRARVEKDKWNMLCPEYHFSLFSKSALCALLHSKGFQILELRTVSGTGEEQGFRRLLARGREQLLSLFHLGNALLVLSGKS